MPTRLKNTTITYLNQQYSFFVKIADINKQTNKQKKRVLTTLNFFKKIIPKKHGLTNELTGLPSLDRFEIVIFPLH